MRMKIISISKAEHLTSFFGGTQKWPIFSLFLVAIPQIFAQVNRSGFLLVSNVVNVEHFSKSRSR